jgi:hypothetical protein
VQRTVLTVDGRLNLPDDLVAFLEAGRVLEYPADDAEPGLLELRRLDQLELREIYYSSAEEGRGPGENEEPNAGDDRTQTTKSRATTPSRS